MAYEASEVMTATALRYTTTQLKKVKDVQQLKDILKRGVGKNVKFGNSSIQIGFLDTMKDVEKEKTLDDMAVGISAARAIRKYMNTEAPLTVYMTGNVWPKEVQDFQVSAYGFKDYNSSDIVVTKDKKTFYGISLKKKKDVKAQDPTLINKAFSSVFDGPEYDKLKEKLIKSRVDYFAALVKEAVQKKIILKKDIKDFDKLDNQELFEAKNRDKNQFGDKAYIDTKGYATADDGYKSSNTTDPKSMRYFVNQKLADKKNKLWKSFEKMINEGAEGLALNLINIILKVNLFKKLDDKKLIGKKFDFSLLTGIGDVKINAANPKGIVHIGEGRVYPLKTTLCGLTRIENKYKKEYKVIQNVEATKKSSAAKIFFTLTKGNLNILDLEIRYKGSFTPRPQFQGTLTKEFKKLLDTETCG